MAALVTKVGLWEREPANGRGHTLLPLPQSLGDPLDPLSPEIALAAKLIVDGLLWDLATLEVWGQDGNINIERVYASITQDEALAAGFRPHNIVYDDYFGVRRVANEAVADVIACALIQTFVEVARNAALGHTLSEWEQYRLINALKQGLGWLLDAEGGAK